jgi:hypothetical protein
MWYGMHWWKSWILTFVRMTMSIIFVNISLHVMPDLIGHPVFYSVPSDIARLWWVWVPDEISFLSCPAVAGHPELNPGFRVKPGMTIKKGGSRTAPAITQWDAKNGALTKIFYG